MSTKRYYWLKLDENFFEDDTIAWLEEQESGKDYVIFYLKLCLRSLKDDGKLIRYVGEKLIPYDVKALSKLTNTSVDTVAVAMKTFIDIGLIEQLESGEIYLSQIDEMVGSETDSAKRVRKHRAKLAVESPKVELLHCNTEETKCNTEKEIEIEKEIDIENREDKVGVELFRKYEDLGYGVLNPSKAEQLKDWLNTFEEKVIIKALVIADNSGKANMNYVNGILKNWKNRGLTTLQRVEAEEQKHHNQQLPKNEKLKNRPGESRPDWLEDNKTEAVQVENKVDQKEFDELLNFFKERSTADD